VLSLIEMHNALGELNKSLEPKYGLRLKMGGGIHTGPAHVGNMGTEDLMDYTAIGDTVNTASRLEGMCVKYGVGSVISKDTADMCGKNFAVKPLDLVRVKGRSEGIPIFTVLGLEDAERKKTELGLWEEAFALYLSGDFESSNRICRSLMEMNREESLYRIFADRTESMSGKMPENWDGVFAYESK
jgi:adenylate cyclase